MSVSTRNDPMTSMPTMLGPSSMAEAASTMNKSVGAITTSGFQGLVSIDMMSRELGEVTDCARKIRNKPPARAHAWPAAAPALRWTTSTEAPTLRRARSNDVANRVLGAEPKTQ